MDARLGSALARGSRVELEEIGTNLPYHALSGALSSTHREVALAAIVAVRGAPDRWRYLAPLAALAHGPDRPLAALAAEVAHGIAQNLDSDYATERDIADDEITEHRAPWLAVATEPGHYADVRVRALEILAGLARFHTDARATLAGYDLAQMIRDDEPEVRRAALELWPVELTDDARALAVKTLTREPDLDVALAAAQILCPPSRGDRSVHDAALAALGDAGQRRLIALLGETQHSPAALLAAARCLAASTDEASRKAVQTLAEAGPEAIRAALGTLLVTTSAQPEGPPRE